MKFSFEDLGKRINETVETVSSKTGEAVEIQRLKNQVRGLEKENQSDLAELGRKVYEQFKAGEVLDEASAALCEAVSGREVSIAGYKQKIMEMKGDSRCESCGKTVAKGMTYCPYCGEKIPASEPTEDDFVDEAVDYAEDVKEKVSDTAEKVVGMAKEAAGKAAEKVSDAVDIVSEKVSKAAETAKDRTEGIVDAAEVKIDDMKEDAAEAVDEAKEAVGEAAEKVKETVEDTVEDAKENIKEAAADVEE